jgi:hypothetical protein
MDVICCPTEFATFKGNLSKRQMGIEILLMYMAVMLLIGPGTILVGIVILVSQKVRLTRNKTLRGGTAVTSGILVIITGFAVTYLFWYMARFFPH